jgi:tetratricopeptide (TPR) repeat protein
VRCKLLSYFCLVEVLILNHRLTYIIFLLAIGLFLLPACSTKKNKFLNRFWHSTNTKFNGYFNGNDALKNGILEVSKAKKDNFNQIITVYDFGSRTGWSEQNAMWDRSIKKGVLMIKKHSMLINGKQYNKYIDDCYLMMGIAHYFKLDFDMGIGQLRYVSENSEKKSTQQLARIWMLRSYVEKGELAEATSVLRQIDKGALDKKIEPEYWPSIAEYRIKSGDFEKAIEALDLSIEKEKTKKKKARYTFVKAQIYQQLKDNANSFAYYSKVLKLRPEYELEFQSKINMALSSEDQSGDDLRKILKKMLKDEKNIDYMDQIYYALGVIDLKEKKKKEAIENFELSSKNSTKNKDQKGVSFLALAKIYFEDRQYEMAQAYYDSTSNFLQKENPEYENVIRLKENLTEVVFNIKVIQLQDSLQRIASMTEKDRIAFLEDYVEKLKQEDEENKNKPAANVQNNNQAGTGGTWYFYNKQAMTFGLSEFKKIWGERVLEDDWRRSNKSSTGVGNEITTNEPIYNPRYDPSTYLKEIPLSDSMLKASYEMIWDALYNLGVVYKEKINDYERSAESFESLVKRNNTNKHFPLTYYQLYLVYKTLNNTDKANNYKSILLREYPLSEYAQILSNENYFAATKDVKDTALALYDNAYQDYVQKSYSTVIAKCEQAMSSYPSSPNLHRFALLKAIAVYESGMKDGFSDRLKEVIKTYKGTESALTAERIIALLIPANQTETTPNQKENETPEKKADNYTFGENEEHFVAIIVPTIKVNVSGATKKITAFNDLEFSNNNLSVTTSLLGTQQQVLLIRRFKNKNESMNYLSVFNKKGVADQLALGSGTSVFAISISNYTLLFKNQDVNNYLKFYSENYTP